MARVLDRHRPGAGVNGVTAIDGYMRELDAALHVRGAARRRFLAECREHLVDAAAARGKGEAVRTFGPPVEVASAFDAEVAARRGARSAFATVAGVLATGGSTLALIHASPATAAAPTAWTIAFFVAAQVAVVAAGLALLQALVMRRSYASPSEVRLLVRRNGCALVAAAVTMFSAGAAAPGHGSALLLLAGPALACVAFVAVSRVRRLARRLDASNASSYRSPLADIRRLTRLPIPLLGTRQLLLATVAMAAAAAFARDRAEHAAVGQAIVTAGVEVVAVLVCFVVLGRPLGLWRRRTRRAPVSRVRA
jgi:hypothetical protein